MGPFGSSLKTHELLDFGKIKTLWIENIVNDEFTWNYQKFISKEKYQELKGFTVKPNDILITMMGTLGKVAIVPKDIGTAIISSHLLKITLEQQKIIPLFLFYLNRGVKDLMSSSSSSSSSGFGISEADKTVSVFR